MAERVSVMHHNIDGTERLVIPVKFFTSKIEEDIGILCVYPVYRMYLVTQPAAIRRKCGSHFKKISVAPFGTPAIMDPNFF